VSSVDGVIITKLYKQDLDYGVTISINTATKKMEMAGSHTEKTTREHNQTGLILEPPRETRKRKTQKHVEARTGDRLREQK